MWTPRHHLETPRQRKGSQLVVRLKRWKTKGIWGRTSVVHLNWKIWMIGTCYSTSSKIKLAQILITAHNFLRSVSAVPATETASRSRRSNCKVKALTRSTRVFSQHPYLVTSIFHLQDKETLQSPIHCRAPCSNKISWRSEITYSVGLAEAQMSCTRCQWVRTCFHLWIHHTWKVHSWIKTQSTRLFVTIIWLTTWLSWRNQVFKDKSNHWN